MPDDGYTEWTITDESFPTMVFERAKNPLQRWTCVSDNVIAAYIDGTLPQQKRVQVEKHLAKCERCRATVADVIKLQRDVELPVPPFAAAKKTLAVPPQVRSRSGLVWAPAVAVVIVLLAAVFIVLRQQPRKISSAPAAVASPPMAAKLVPTTPNEAAVQDITRQPLIPSTVPVILTPQQDSTVAGERLEFTWKPLARSRYYDLSVVTSEGDLLWAGRTEACSVRLPRAVVLKHGEYFVWVTAYLTDGQVAKSSPIKFAVDR